ncbi:hypothetical protein Y032_0238g3276 [Ancylostoma ceylanicum]|uniref:Uncharacterized protein n=1 Tax=Ancylostoma ceylanicum TaxID=53326 RepID=A0A016SED4_9BILA|nr:hypothetical protein Y032_0238g3276 [Ancylostoma ceylanicum]
MLGFVLLAAELCFVSKAVDDTEVQTLYAVDLNQPISESDAWCFKISQYSAVFLRAFAPFQSDGFESSVCQSIWNAKQGKDLCIWFPDFRERYPRKCVVMSELHYARFPHEFLAT